MSTVSSFSPPALLLVVSQSSFFWASQMAHAATRTPATAVQRGSATRHRRTGAPTRPRLAASSTTHTIKWRLSSAKRVAELDDEGLAWSVAQLRAEAYFEESTNRFKKSLERKYAQREEEALLAHLRLKPGAKCWDGSNVKVCLLVHGDQSNDDVIGALDVSLRDDWVYLDNVCVSEEARRRGVASALVRAAAEKAAGWGVHAVYAHVVKGNTPAEVRTRLVLLFYYLWTQIFANVFPSLFSKNTNHRRRVMHASVSSIRTTRRVIR